MIYPINIKKKIKESRHLKENVRSVASVAAWLKDSIAAMTANQELTISRRILDSNFGFYVYWTQGFDINDESVIHADADKSYGLVAALKCRNDAEWDGEYMDSPYDPKTGDLYCEDYELSPKDNTEMVAEWLLEDYNSMIDLINNNPEIIIGGLKESFEDDDFNESLNESKPIKEGTFHWSDNKAAYEAIKVKNALKKAFNTHVFQDDSQNLYIPFNFWGRKDAEKAGVTIDTVGKFLNSIGYKYTGKSEDDEDVYNYLKDDVKIELYEVDSNRYAIHLDFDSEVDDKLDIDTTSFSSYVNTDDVDAVQDLLLDIVEGRVKTLGDIVISEEDIKNIKELCGRTLDMYTYDFAGYSDDIVDKIDDYFAMKQYQELHNKHVDESKSIKESNDSAENLSDKVKSVLDKKSQLKGLLNVTSTGETSADIDLTVEHPWDGQWSISTMKDIIESALKELGVSYELDVIDSPNGKWTTYRYSVSSGLKESIKEGLSAKEVLEQAKKLLEK